MLAFLQREKTLEGADPDMAMAEASQNGRTGRAGLVATLQFFARFDYAEGFRRVDAQRFQHFGRHDLSHRAL